MVTIVRITIRKYVILFSDIKVFLGFSVIFAKVPQVKMPCRALEGRLGCGTPT